MPLRTRILNALSTAPAYTYLVYNDVFDEITFCFQDREKQQVLESLQGVAEGMRVSPSRYLEIFLLTPPLS